MPTIPSEEALRLPEQTDDEWPELSAFVPPKKTFAASTQSVPHVAPPPLEKEED